jgi:uncharacterized membrane protein
MSYFIMKRIFTIFFLFLFLFVPIVSGAQIYGSIYDQNLEAISDVVVQVNSTPQQRHISKYGGYSFNLEPGTYKIIATLTKNFVTKEIASENITISKDGTYIVDLFIYQGINVTQEFTASESPWWMPVLLVFGSLILVGILVLLVLLIRLLVLRKKANPSKDHVVASRTEDVDVSFNIELEHEESVIEDNSDPLKKRILDLLAKNNGTLTQKEIRRKTNLSEAKISHTISELCVEGRIEKVRKGRSNVLVLK